MKLIRKLYRKKFIRFGVIPFILLFFWFFFTVILNSYSGLSVLEYPQTKGDFIQEHTNEILAKQKVDGEFTSRDKDLGIVSVRFNTYHRINSDRLIFRIREKGQKEWFYQNSYLVDQFQPDKFFTFGFPIIPNSLGTRYQFELESIKGKKNNAVAISTITPTFLTKYQYSRQELTANKKLLIMFIIKKFVNSFSNLDFVLSSFVYLLPLIYYILWQLTEIKTSLRIHSTIVYVAFLIVLLINIIYVDQFSSQLAVYLLLGIWVLIVKSYKLDSSFSFIYAIIFLIVTVIALLFNDPNIPERASLWAYTFMVIGAIQQIVEYKLKANTLLTYKSLFKRV